MAFTHAYTGKRIPVVTGLIRSFYLGCTVLAFALMFIASFVSIVVSIRDAGRKSTGSLRSVAAQPYR